MFQPYYVMKLKPLGLKCWYFEASEDITTKFKWQGLWSLHISKESNIEMPVGVAPPPGPLSFQPSGKYNIFTYLCIRQLEFRKSCLSLI